MYHLCMTRPPVQFEAGGSINGNGKVLWWIMGLIGSLVGGVLISDRSKSDELVRRLSEVERQTSVLDSELRRDRDYTRERLENIKQAADAIAASIQKK